MAKAARCEAAIRSGELSLGQVLALLPHLLEVQSSNSAFWELAAETLDKVLTKIEAPQRLRPVLRRKLPQPAGGGLTTASREGGQHLVALLERLLAPGTIIDIASGECVPKRGEEHMRAVQQGPKKSEACAALASSMLPSEVAVLLSGKVATRAELYIEAIRLRPADYKLRLSLAAVLGPFETVELRPGKSVGRRELLQEAIRLCPSKARAY